MMPIAQINFFYIKQRQVKMKWGTTKREGEREREKWIKGLGDGA